MKNQKQMFEASFERPSDFFELDTEVQWAIDKSLGILDWEGGNLSEEEKQRFKDHYDYFKNNPGG